MSEPVEMILYDANAEKAVLGSMMIDPDTTLEVVQILAAEDFGLVRSRNVFAVLLSLFDQNMPYDTWLIMDESKKLGLDVEIDFVVDCSNYPTAMYAVHYSRIVKKYSDKRHQSAIATEYAKRIFSGEDPAVTNEWLAGEMTKRVSGGDSNMSLNQSIDRQRELIEKWESPENQAELDRWSWAWGKWNHKISPPPAGIITLVSAAEGTGKTIVAEVQAEHWAQMGNNVVFFHMELNRDVMITRRLCRLSGIPYRALVSNKLTPQQRQRRDSVESFIAQWTGNIEYISCAGWNVDQIVTECKRLKKAGLCDVFIIDYFQKIQISPRQERRRMDENAYHRDAMEQLAVLANETENPCRGMVLSQLTKAAKQKAASFLSGSDLMGTGALGEKANVSVMLHKEILVNGKDDTAKGVVVEPGGYDNRATVKVVKNTLGSTGDFEQYSTSTFDWRDQE